ISAVLPSSTMLSLRGSSFSGSGLFSAAILASSSSSSTALLLGLKDRPLFSSSLGAGGDGGFTVLFSSVAVGAFFVSFCGASLGFSCTFSAAFLATGELAEGCSFLIGLLALGCLASVSLGTSVTFCRLNLDFSAS